MVPKDVNQRRSTVSTLDSVLFVISNPDHRQIFTALADENPLFVHELIQSDGVTQRQKLNFNNRVLPRLDDLGFITWNRELDMIEKGPRFGDVQTVFHVLEENSDELPGDLD